MKISLDNETYTLPLEYEDELSEKLHDTIEQQYKNLDPAMRLVAKTAARSILGFLEKNIREKGGQDAALLLCRPPKGSDPVLHLLGAGQVFFMEMMHAIQLNFTTESGIITSVTLSKDTGEGGGQVDFDGNVGQRQDDGTQTSG